MQHRQTIGRRGFTLVELTIATAITTIILGAIVALFVFALRAVRSGNAAMDANELTRAAFATIERDLNTAFTSREHGELFHFHGNEVGMSFIGLVRTYDVDTSRDVVQLGRVTYVINPSLNFGENGIDDDNDGLTDLVEDPDEGIFDLIPMETLDTTTGDMIEVVLPSEILRTPGNDADIRPGVRTISLIRYFEPGVESLDEYDPQIQAAFEAAELPATPEFETALQRKFRTTMEALDLDGVRDAQIFDEARRNFRRDAYIRMLANAEVLDPNNGVYPNGWPLLEPACPTCDPRDPYDYVIAENILDLESQDALNGGDPTPFLTDEIQRRPYFLYGRIALNASSEHVVEYAYTWNSNANVFEIADNPVGDFSGTGVVEVGPDPQPWQTFGAIGTPLQARLPEVVRVRLPFVFDSPYSGAPHLQRVLQQDIRVPTAYTRRNPLAGMSP